MSLIKANRSYSISTGQGDNQRESNQAIFYKACASTNRLEGKCHLFIICKNSGGKREFDLHTFVLCFNHEGIKEYRINKFFRKEKVEPHTDFPKEYMSLTLMEAAALIQDAYRQNVRFNTRPAGFTQYCLFLEYDTTKVNRTELFYKLTSHQLTPTMFINIYLAALRRMDNSLLYDLSSRQRQAVLGDRTEFLKDFGKEYSDYTFLKSGVILGKRNNGVFQIDAYAVVSTEQEQLIRISYRFLVIKDGGYYYVDDMKVLGHENIAGDHPENPLNYEVFCSVYSLNRAVSITEWMENDPEIILIGELNNCCFYKWVQGQDVPWYDYDVTEKIVSEIIVTDYELIVYAKKPHNLVKVEKMVIDNFFGEVQFKDKYYMPVHKLNGMVFSGDYYEKLFCERYPDINQYRVSSMLIYLKQNKMLFKSIHRSADYKLMLGQKSWYIFRYGRQKAFQDNFAMVEYYVADNWMLVNVLRGDWEEEIAFLKSKRDISIIYSHEIENNFDLFNPPISEKRKWQIYGLLKLFEKEGNIIREMGMIPSLKEVVQVMGSLKTGTVR